MQANTIDQVIAMLDDIIEKSKNTESTLGYFAALYRKVTIKVKEGIANDIFENGPRMERLDVIFANRYLKAYSDYQNNETVTQSWGIAFKMSTQFWPIVLQHLLIGMNAHINLDLGIAAAEVSKGEDINDLHHDFNQINTILSSLVDEVENELASIWPTLRKLLKWTRKVDNFLVDFSMELARDGAWKFATALANTPEDQKALLIQQRDGKVAKNGSIVSNPGIIASIILGIIRLGEKGSVSTRIETLAN